MHKKSLRVLKPTADDNQDGNGKECTGDQINYSGTTVDNHFLVSGCYRLSNMFISVVIFITEIKGYIAN